MRVRRDNARSRTRRMHPQASARKLQLVKRQRFMCIRTKR
jgi:hypothetical protein